MDVVERGRIEHEVARGRAVARADKRRNGRRRVVKARLIPLPLGLHGGEETVHVGRNVGLFEPVAAEVERQAPAAREPAGDFNLRAAALEIAGVARVGAQQRDPGVAHDLGQRQAAGAEHVERGIDGVDDLVLRRVQRGLELVGADGAVLVDARAEPAAEQVEADGVIGPVPAIGSSTRV